MSATSEVERIAYLDCSSGIAGDMLLAALLDAGASSQNVLRELEKLPIEGWRLWTETVSRAGVRGLKADVVTRSPAPPRTLEDIRAMIRRADLPEAVERLALGVFEALAAAEAHVHGAELAMAHLHEAGDDDAIVDVVGCCAAYVDLGITRLTCSPIAVGSGTVETSHGTLPVPAPAVSELLRDVAVVAGGEGELTTPTGAALAVTLSDDFGPMPAMTLRSVGWGAGEAERERPNLLRVLVGERSAGEQRDEVVELEATIDDMSPELLADAVDTLIRTGALDAWIVPAVMKKGRPGFVLHALAVPSSADLIRDTILRETTTFGVRSHLCERATLDREWKEVEVAGQKVRLKIGRRGGSEVTVAVEHADAAAAARATGLPLKEVYRLAQSAGMPVPERPRKD